MNGDDDQKKMPDVPGDAGAGDAAGGGAWTPPAGPAGGEVPEDEKKVPGAPAE